MKKSILSQANSALRAADYEEAIRLYDIALIDAEDPIRQQILSNRELAIKNGGVLDLNKKRISQIPRIRFDNTEELYQEHTVLPKIQSSIKAIAFYLPQFHPIKENNDWWGHGFTEWLNVGKAKPNYEGHYQPHCPIHFGYYDLRVPEIMEEQAKIARQYGIGGFCFYYYWFGGKTLLEYPLLTMLNNEKVDIPFCLAWANENWTRRWDGQDNDVLIGQEHSPEDSIAFIRNISKYFKDSRYIRVDNKPLLIVYRANIIPDIEETAKLWRVEVRKLGFDGVYLVAAQTFGIKSPAPFGFDAAVEFPPHTVQSTDVRHDLKVNNPEFSGYIFSYDQCVENAVKSKEPEYKLFRSAMLSWDNTARKQNASHIFHGFSLLKYKQWLDSLCAKVANQSKYSAEEKLVFINAWNEWAEGTHLEPDRKYGFSYLKTTYDVLKKYELRHISGASKEGIKQRNNLAVIIHIHYVEMWGYIKSYLSNFGDIGFDLYVTTTSPEVFDLVKMTYSEASVVVVENRGRDIFPFIETLRKIHHLKYDAICKIHSKRSSYREDGDRLRDRLYDSLLGSRQKIDSIIQSFGHELSLGILVPSDFLLPHTERNMTYDTEMAIDLAKIMGIDFSYSSFPAGSMFWFRQQSLSRLLMLDTSTFPPEEGLADGTPAHAVERLFCVAAESIGYIVRAIE